MLLFQLNCIHLGLMNWKINTIWNVFRFISKMIFITMFSFSQFNSFWLSIKYKRNKNKNYNWSKFVEWNDFWAEMFVHNFFEKMKEINCWHNYKQLDDTLPLLSAAIAKYKTTIIVCIKQINSLIFLNEYRWNHSSSWFLKLKELEVIRHDKCIHLFLKTS